MKSFLGVQGAPWHGGPIKVCFFFYVVFQFFTFTCNLHLSPLAEKRPPGRRRQKIKKSLVSLEIFSHFL